MCSHYQCQYHPLMTNTISVDAAAASVTEVTTPVIVSVTRAMHKQQAHTHTHTHTHTHIHTNTTAYLLFSPMLSVSRLPPFSLCVCVCVLVCVVVRGAPSVSASNASDYVSSVPSTVYDSGMMSPQNMDYDALHQRFTPHPGWIHDQLIFYYKFRMYTPMTYPTRFGMGKQNSIPIAPAYITTTNYTWEGTHNTTHTSHT